LGISIAPVTDWKFYDTMYTERYMKTYSSNKEGYEESAVEKMAGFRNAKFLLASGTADDNVHFHNAAKLVWNLVGAGISSDQYRVQYFTDSDHSISANGAGTAVYGLIQKFLCDNFKVECN
jgi:dipeptidyl aminopeptidase/acylaminoacyl peptidase